VTAMADQRPGAPRPAPELSEAQKRRRRLRNWALLAALGGFVLLVYLVALVKMGYYK
jgi:hypothetical protein